MIKDEGDGWWIGSGDYAICSLRVVLCKGKGERSKCKNYKGISLLSVVGKIYAGILVVEFVE